MNENTNSMMPELTLGGEAAQMEMPTLVLGNEPAPEVVEEKKIEPVVVDDSMLTEAERKIVADVAEKIDITDSTQVLQYGAAAQKNIAGFSENALSNVRTKDLGEIGEALSSLVVELKGFGQAEKKGILGFFQKKRNELEAMKASYSKAEEIGRASCRERVCEAV